MAWRKWALMGWLALGAVHAAEPVVAAPAAALPSADVLLADIDRNLTFKTRTATVRMTVVSRERARTYVMRTWGRGVDEAATEYVEPARDTGTRMLRLGNDLWTYLPSVERVQKISGEMLRQGMMGSDLSYEDMMGAAAWREQYEATVVGAEAFNGRPAWKIEMKARDATVAYPRRVAWVDQETRIPVRQELYALSGMLLKTWDMTDVREFDGGRRFPTKMVIIDQLKAGSSTILEMTEMSFGVELEEEVFSRRWLERR